MNDISFRAWHNEREWMYEVTSISFKTATVGIEYDGITERVPANEVVLLPFTGLMDTNGRRIYKGDIVIAWSQGVCGKFEVSLSREGSPGWILGCGRRDGVSWNLHGQKQSDGSYKDDVEVVGNIYENPGFLD